VATAAVPDGVVVEVFPGAIDSSPSQERLTRIAAMLRHAEQSMPATDGRSPWHRKERREQRGRRAS
jgi:hypothetical protein